jgi:hypothetical protein
MMEIRRFLCEVQRFEQEQELRVKMRGEEENLGSCGSHALLASERNSFGVYQWKC